MPARREGSNREHTAGLWVWAAPLAVCLTWVFASPAREHGVACGLPAASARSSCLHPAWSLWFALCAGKFSLLCAVGASGAVLGKVGSEWGVRGSASATFLFLSPPRSGAQEALVMHRPWWCLWIAAEELSHVQKTPLKSSQCLPLNQREEPCIQERPPNPPPEPAGSPVLLDPSPAPFHPSLSSA